MLFVDATRRAQRQHGLRVYAWVVMPEHVHILCKPADDSQLSPVLRSLKMSVKKQSLNRWRELHAPILPRLADATGRPRFWLKGGGFDRNVRSEEEFAREVRYIHRNPVERQLVERPEDWRWSSVRWWMGIRQGEFECDPAPGVPGFWDRWKGFN